MEVENNAITLCRQLYILIRNPNCNIIRTFNIQYWLFIFLIGYLRTHSYLWLLLHFYEYRD